MSKALVCLYHRSSSAGEYSFLVLFLACLPHQQILAFSKCWQLECTVILVWFQHSDLSSLLLVTTTGYIWLVISGCAPLLILKVLFRINHWQFCSESTTEDFVQNQPLKVLFRINHLSLCCYALACEKNMVATLQFLLLFFARNINCDVLTGRSCQMIELFMPGFVQRL